MRQKLLAWRLNTDSSRWLLLLKAVQVVFLFGMAYPYALLKFQVALWSPYQVDFPATPVQVEP